MHFFVSIRGELPRMVATIFIKGSGLFKIWTNSLTWGISLKGGFIFDQEGCVCYWKVVLDKVVYAHGCSDITLTLQKEAIWHISKGCEGRVVPLKLAAPRTFENSIFKERFVVQNPSISGDGWAYFKRNYWYFQMRSLHLYYQLGWVWCTHLSSFIYDKQPQGEKNVYIQIIIITSMYADKTCV